MAKTRVGLIGCGLAATGEHLPALRAHPDVEVAALCDRDRARARAAAERAGVDAGVYDDPDAMLREARLDAVFVLTPPESHAALALAAFDAGCDVLIEKPFVYTLAEADRVIERARATGRRFTVVHNSLFYAAFRELAARLARGEIGALVSLHFLSGKRNQTFVPDAWYFETHGGRLGETLPHALALLVALLPGLELVHADARTLGHRIAPPGMDDARRDKDELYAELWSRERNALAHLHYSLNWELGSTLIAAGTEGHLIANTYGAVVWQESGNASTGRFVEPPRSFVDKVRRRLGLGPRRRGGLSGHALQIAEFVAHLRTGAPLTVTPESAREVVRLWEAIVSRYAAPRP